MPRTIRQQAGQCLERLDYAGAGPVLGVGLAFGLVTSMALLGFLDFALAAAVFVTLLVSATLLGVSGTHLRVASLALDIEPPPQGLPNPPHRVMPRDLWIDLDGGTFQMGSPDGENGRFDDEGPVHPVTLSGFQMMRVPVTRGLYEDVMGQDPGWPEAEDAAERPVNNVSWFDAVRFCNALSEAEGLQVCYEEKKQDAFVWHRSRDGYRLPTEAEWEVACRAGTSTRFSCGDSDAKLEAVAWYAANSKGEPRPVGQLLPNPWGLLDMHGNVYEWCWDWFGAYEGDVPVDPTGPRKGEGSVLRGGSFLSGPQLVRSAYRCRFRPVNRFRDIGFRCVRGPHPQLDPLAH